MLGQVEELVINKLVEKLNAHGLKITAEDVKTAVANSPQIVQQIESILLSSNTDEKLEKIKTLIAQAAGTATTTK